MGEDELLKKSFLVFLMIFLIAGLCSNVQAHSGDEVVAVYGTTPTINGEIASGEWDADSSIVAFSVNDDYDCTAYVKQDGSNLYIACDIPDPTIETDLGLDRIWIYLDVEHNGGTKPQTDDIGFRIDRDGTTKELNGTGTGFQYTVVTDWTGGAYSTSAWWQVEYSISYSKIGVTAGQAKTLGICFYTYDHTGGTPKRGEWPSGSNSQSPNTWADLTFPTLATIESCDSLGVTQNTFHPSEEVYVVGNGYAPSTIAVITYPIYVVEDVTWVDDMSIPDRVSGTVTTVSSDSLGNVIPTLVWNSPLIPGKYDIVVDVNYNGFYDVGIDALDDSDIEVTAGFFVIPEFYFGPILGLAACFSALAVFLVYKRKHQ
jgi:hypothetical protein